MKLHPRTLKPNNTSRKINSDLKFYKLINLKTALPRTQFFSNSKKPSLEGERRLRVTGKGLGGIDGSHFTAVRCANCSRLSLAPVLRMAYKEHTRYTRIPSLPSHKGEEEAPRLRLAAPLDQTAVFKSTHSILASGWLCGAPRAVRGLTPPHTPRPSHLHRHLLGLLLSVFFELLILFASLL